MVQEFITCVGRYNEKTIYTGDELRYVDEGLGKLLVWFGSPVADSKCGRTFAE